MTERIVSDSSNQFKTNYHRISDLINSTPTLGEMKKRFHEVFSSFREEERVKRHEQRVKVLTDMQNRGEIVFNERVEVD